jgi:hypothetical protein
MRRGFIESDDTWDDTMAEAVVFQSPNQLRRLFVLLLLECHISKGSAKKLWEKYAGDLAEDIAHQNPNRSHE